MPENKPPRPAYVVDVDENGKQVHGTRRSAMKEKEKPKVSQREDRLVKIKKPHSDSGDKSAYYAQALEVMPEKETRLERRQSVSASTRSPRKGPRPPLTHENRASTSGKLSVPQRSPRDIPSNYGIPPPAVPYGPPAPSTQAMAIPLRPRAVTTQTYPNKPPSYHPPPITSNGTHGPPLSMSAYYQHQPVITPSYPPPSANNSYMRYAATPGSMQAVDYFAPHITQPPPRPLSARFDAIPRSQLAEPITRTTSAFGTRDTHRQSMDGQFEEGYYDDSYASRVSDPSARRREIARLPTVRTREDPDTIAMPPPPPPAPRPILRRPVTDYPIETDTRTEYTDRSERPDRPERHERHERHDRQIERRERPEFREPPKARRPSANRHSVSYDLGKDSDRVRIETANNGRRRQSYYGQSTATGASSGYEDKISSAANYQEEIAGPTVPLTTDMLKRQQKRAGGSSRSTNSGSRDESDYNNKKSVTTRTTRSGSGNDDDNFTIKVTGQARVVVGGTQIDCTDGGEISISRQKSIRNGSERGSEYSAIPPQRQIDDRRSRVDRPIGRTRISSSHSYTRSTPQYDNYL